MYCGLDVQIHLIPSNIRICEIAHNECNSNRNKNMSQHIDLFLLEVWRKDTTWEDNTEMDLTDIGWVGMDWIHLVQNRAIGVLFWTWQWTFRFRKMRWMSLLYGVSQLLAVLDISAYCITSLHEHRLKVSEKETWTYYEETGGSIKMHNEELGNLYCLVYLTTVSPSGLYRVDDKWIWSV
jgi:hypothetical protein